LFGLVGDFPFPSSDHRLVWMDLAKHRPPRAVWAKHGWHWKR
jgi:hypothetical protein